MTADESPEVAVSEPEDERWQPVEQPAVPSQPEPKQPIREPGEVGTPAGQMALGAASVVTVTGLGLYQAAGVLGLIATGGAAVAGAGGYGYWRFRRAYPRQKHDRSERGPRAAKASRSMDLGLGGGKSRGAGRRMTFGADSRPGRRSSASSRMPSLGVSRSSGRPATERRVALGTPTAPGRARGAFRLGRETRSSRKTNGERRMQGRHAAAQTVAHAATAPLRAVRRAGRATRHRVAQAGRAARAYASPRIARARAASRLLDERTGHLASRAGRRIIKTARAADQRTGGHLSRAWRRIRQLITRFDPPKPQPEPTPQPDPAPQPAAESAPAAPPQPAPIRTLPVRTPTRRHFPMSQGSPLIVVSADMIGAVSRYLPHDMWDVARDLDQLHQVPENIARALGVYTTNLEAAYPIDHRVTQMMGEFYAAMATPSAMAMEIASAFRKIHADEIKRKDAPRTGEHLWNV